MSTSKLTREHVLKLAELAKLQLSDDEVEKFQTELSTILSYVEQLSDVATEGLEMTSQVTGLQNVSRDDVERTLGATPDELLKRAPATKGRYLKVKRMIS